MLEITDRPVRFLVSHEITGCKPIQRRVDGVLGDSRCVGDLGGFVCVFPILNEKPKYPFRVRRFGLVRIGRSNSSIVIGIGADWGTVYECISVSVYLYIS